MCLLSTLPNKTKVNVILSPLRLASEISPGPFLSLLKFVSLQAPPPTARTSSLFCSTLASNPGMFCSSRGWVLVSTLDWLWQSVSGLRVLSGQWEENRVYVSMTTFPQLFLLMLANGFTVWPCFSSESCFKHFCCCLSPGRVLLSLQKSEVFFAVHQPPLTSWEHFPSFFEALEQHLLESMKTSFPNR